MLRPRRATLVPSSWVTMEPKLTSDPVPLVVGMRVRGRARGPSGPACSSSPISTPVLNEAAPYLSNLRPGTELKMTRDLRLDKVVRRGVEEDFAQLSGGTREQLSVIVRIALARVLAKDKRPLPLILDDTMGWTDDLRFLSMVKILRDASRELQLILLTCHGGRFDRLSPDYSADLDELKRRAAAR